MSSVVITSFFTRNGLPATDLETLAGGGYPLVRVWEVTDGTPAGDAFVGEFQMIPIEDGTNDDGLYKHEFTNAQGYDDSKTYVFRADGGPSLLNNERYQVARLDPTETSEGIADAVWDEPRVDHLIPGSTGEALSQIKADTTNIADRLYLNADSVQEIAKLLLKFEAGRTRIDASNNTLTVYDEDCTTPLRVFELLDSSGNPSVNEVCERKPIAKGVGDSTTITDVCP